MVHADHAGIQPMLHRLGLFAIAGEDVGGEPEGQAVGAFEHVVEALERGQRRERAERLLTHDHRGVRCILDDRGRVEIALVSDAGATGSDLGADILGVGHEAFHHVETTVGDKRAHLHAVVHAVADLERVGAFGHPVGEFGIDVFLNIEPGRRDADLARIAELEARHRVERIFHIGVVEDHDRGVAAKLHRRAGHVIGGELGQVLADRDRAGEGEFLEHRRGEQVARDRVRHAEDHVADAVRQARVL